MDRKLIEAAQKGDVHQLLSLAKDDPLLLEVVALSGQETPLHIACMRRNLNVVKELLNLRPEFAMDLNPFGLSPLHIAAANGDLEIVKELLKINSSLCVIKGKERRIPLHYAVIKGRVEVTKELLLASEDSIKEVTGRGETSLDLAVKNNQFEAFKSLAVYLKANAKRIYSIRKMLKGKPSCILPSPQSNMRQVAELMLDENFVNKGTLEVNSLNKKGVTPLDVLLSQGDDCEIEEMLRLVRSYAVVETHVRQQQAENVDTSANGLRRERPRKPSKKLQDYFKYDKTKDSPSKVRTILLVITVLIATATYQAVLNPQDDSMPTNDTTTTNDAKQSPAHTAGKSIMGTKDIKAFSLFLFFNSVGFFMSIHMLFFLTKKFPLQLELYVSLIALIATYNTSMAALLPNGTLHELYMPFPLLCLS